MHSGPQTVTGAASMISGRIRSVYTKQYMDAEGGYSLATSSVDPQTPHPAIKGDVAV